jgi:cytochrome subunit of sulfide dehydrogenase
VKMKMTTAYAALVLAGAAMGGLTLVGSARAADVNTLVETCANCHGKDGASTTSDVPIIGGYSSAYIVDSLKNYKNKDRPCPEVKFNAGPHKGEPMDMCKVAGNLSEDDMKLIGDYLAAKPFVRAKQTFDAEKAKRGKTLHEANCKKCHDNGGSSPDDDAGILAGQWMPYIQHTFDEFTSGKRQAPKKMQPKLEKLQKTDIDDLINYFGSFQ